MCLGGWYFLYILGGSGFVVLVCNGNVGDWLMCVELVVVLYGLGLLVLLFDYCGYGGNLGWLFE